MEREHQRTTLRERLTYAALFFGLALLIHGVILLPLLQVLFTAIPDGDPADPISIDLWENRLASEEPQTPEEELEEYTPEKDIPDGHVVRLPNANDRAPIKKPRFLSEKNSRAEVETQSRVRARQAPGQPASPPTTMESRDKSTKNPQQTSFAEAHIDMFQSPQDSSDRDALAPRTPKSPNQVNTVPTTTVLNQAIAGSGLDYFDDVVEGDVTSVNAAAFEFASFFNRVKQKVEQHWHPGVAFNKHDPHGNIYGSKDRVTVLLVVLYPNGNLKKLYVMTPSGAGFLDDEAYNAVAAAAPFPNVPEGLRSKKDGLVKFTFHFILEIGTQPILRMRRYQ